MCLGLRLRSAHVDHNLKKLSFNDFGAGVGQYGHALLSKDPGFLWRGFDGAGNIEAVTDGFVDWFDLTLPLSLPRAHWVISLEVGEHLAPSDESMFIRNLHAHNCLGIILSWALPGQNGYHHINTHSNHYVIDIFLGLGYFYNEPLSQEFRSGAKYDWFRHSIMVFERYRPHGGCR